MSYIIQNWTVICTQHNIGTTSRKMKKNCIFCSTRCPNSKSALNDNFDLGTLYLAFFFWKIMYRVFHFHFSLFKSFFWPYFGKAKMCLRDITFIQFSKIVYIFQLLVYNFSKNLLPHKHAFWLLQQRVKSAPFQFYSHLLLTIFNWNTL